MAETIRKPKPIAGALWGIPLGLGLALLAINSKIISLSIAPIVGLVVVGIVIGILWGFFGPAKKPKGPEPVSASPRREPAVVDPEPPSEPVVDPSRPTEPRADPAVGDASSIADLPDQT